MENESSCTIDDLPVEILCIIFRNLDIKSMVNASFVNKTWNEACLGDPTLGRIVRKRKVIQKNMRWNRRANGDARFNFKAGRTSRKQFIDKQMRLRNLKTCMSLENLEGEAGRVRADGIRQEMLNVLLLAALYQEVYNIPDWMSLFS